MQTYPLEEIDCFADINCILENCGYINEKGLLIKTGNFFALNYLLTLLEENLNITAEIKKKKGSFWLEITEQKNIDLISDKIGKMKTPAYGKNYLALSFLTTGSVSDPKKNYHLEFIINRKNNAEVLRGILKSYGINSKQTQRRKNYVVYIKEGDGIVDFLRLVAHKALMEFENIRILKNVRGNINREINMETANSSKTIEAALKQKEEILLIWEKKGHVFLEPHLQSLATLRVNNTWATLKELGEKCEPEISKSCVNHRLRKISQVAKQLKSEENI